ncbi:MAG: protein translocase subunit SecD [Dehalococcoidia bacterium]
MGRWWNRILLVLILAVTAFSIVAVWPSEPERYLTSSIPWPEGKGIKLYLPAIKGETFEWKKIERRAMSLGLDLRGGARLVLEPEEGFQVEDLDAALDGARRVVERRVNEFGVAESEVNRLGNDQLEVQLPGIDPEEAKAKISRTGLLQFCVPVRDETGNVAIVQQGTVTYETQTCRPERDAQGNVVVEGGTVEFVPWAPSDSTASQSNPAADQIVWEPAQADLNGVPTELSGRFLSKTAVIPNPDTLDLQNPWLLQFEWNGDGSDISGLVTEDLATSNYPLAAFLDGVPICGDEGSGTPNAACEEGKGDHIIAPRVQSKITDSGVITGLERGDADELSKLLNIGAFPVPLQVVLEKEVDATLGDTAVRDSVIAGEVALLIIMLFMVLYYRLPGVMASLALITYTSVSLAVFKIGLPGIGPIVLTLAGVGAFVLSVGMAVDANILIFERMKEELRVGRNLVVALEDGFNRAWSSIRDSNISTLITCVILYWFGDQFGESAIKSFALTLGIGVAISMFSAIIVTRTYMRLIVGFRFVSKRHWLFAPDLPEAARLARGRVPAVAGGATSRAGGATSGARDAGEER